MAKSTQEEREANENRNIRAVADFKNHWLENDIDLHSKDLGLFFEAQVSYSSPLRSIVERTNVKVSLSGFGTDGMIDIYETDDMTVDDYHLRVIASFSKYTFKKSSGELVISNESPKMGGKYSIRILPIG